MKYNRKNPLQKVTVATLYLVLVGLFAVTSCDKLRNLRVNELVEVVVTTPVCKDVTFSTCKRTSESIRKDASDVEITYKNKWLYITHKDILLNCGFEEINVTTLMIGNTIEVNIEENPRSLRCLCPVDISYSIGEFEEGTYVLVIKHINQQIYSQTINF